jgi:hypothetical protein
MTDRTPDGDATQVDVPVTDRTMAMPAVAGTPPGGGSPPPAGPPDRPGDRQWWIIVGLLVAILLVGLAILLLGDDDDETATTDTSTTSSVVDTTTSSTTTSVATTTTESTTTTTEAPPPTVDPALCTSGPPDDPGASVQVAYEAYTLGDLECASQLGTAEAIDALFSIPGGGGGWTYQGCTEQDVPDPHIDCAYTFAGGATHFKTSYSETAGWVIFEVYQTAD